MDTEILVQEVEKLICPLCGQLISVLSFHEGEIIEAACLNQNHYHFAIDIHHPDEYSSRRINHIFGDQEYEIYSTYDGELYHNVIVFHNNKNLNSTDILTVYKSRSVGPTQPVFLFNNACLLNLLGPKLDFFFQKLTEDQLIDKISFYNTFS